MQGDLLLAEARRLRSAGDKAKALALLDRAASTGGGVEHALDRERGLLALELGKLDMARELLQASATAGPPDWRVHSGLGVALATEGRQHEAQLAFARALELAPEHPAVLNNLALSYALDGKHEQAEKLLRRVAQARSASSQVKQNLDLVLELKREPGEARKMAASRPPTAQPDAKARDLSGSAATRSASERSDPSEPQRTAGASLPDATAPIYRLGGPDHQ